MKKKKKPAEEGKNEKEMINEGDLFPVEVSEMSLEDIRYPEDVRVAFGHPMRGVRSDFQREEGESCEEEEEDYCFLCVVVRYFAKQAKKKQDDPTCPNRSRQLEQKASRQMGMRTTSSDYSLSHDSSQKTLVGESGWEAKVIVDEPIDELPEIESSWRRLMDHQNGQWRDAPDRMHPIRRRHR
ncbi:hypothetical protein GCK72_020166 [Caenorhabditis remanei]|uniref:Uncharacterized protein n=1 Tax=Caenorhabditis remanei TaxID=31234 RepID=A0A6A5GGR3_CAERE|nr:hypothetical protein GCK72_020166 [Caenorhabditis remanei]KAF1753609.1 hypothetical protein GCK72_020166 [Caenorhabditis remanei]